MQANTYGSGAAARNSQRISDRAARVSNLQSPMSWRERPLFAQLQSAEDIARINADAAVRAAQAGTGSAAQDKQGTIGTAAANAYGAYGVGLGNVATAQANERSNFYGANALAEQARQNALSNIGAAGLGAYGSAANSALGAWASNQNAYNQAASNMQAANQSALSNYGVGRAQALGQAATASGQLGGALGNAARVDSRYASMGGGGGYGAAGGFGAYGPTGGVASGSFTGGGGLGGLAVQGGGSSGPGPAFGGVVNQGFGAIGGAMQGLMSPDIVASMNYGAGAGRQQLDDQHYSSRMMPSQMLGQTLSGLTDLTGQNVSAVSRGMDQYYGAATDPRNRGDYSGMVDGITRGFNATRSTLRALGDLAPPSNQTAPPQPQEPLPTPLPAARQPARSQQAQLPATERLSPVEEARIRSQIANINERFRGFQGFYDPTDTNAMVSAAQARARIAELSSRLRGGR